MRYLLIVLWILFGSVTSAIAQVSIGISFSFFPELVQVPGYPVYYAPRLGANFFFYDGLYWVYQQDNWYASSWYNGPWDFVGPESVPLFVLRIPVSYYRNPPAYFRQWRSDAPPRWGEHWGNAWERRRSGWDSWSRSSVPAPAPLPTYQRQYSGDRYPRVEQQQVLHSQNYRYEPREAVVRQPAPEQASPRTPVTAPREQQGMPQERSFRQPDSPRSIPSSPLEQGRSGASRAPSPQRGDEELQRSAPSQAPARQRGPAVQEQMPQVQQGAAQHERQTPNASQENVQHGPGASQEPRQGRGQERDKGDERGQERGQERGEGRGEGRNR
jgi:hypothetical protein